MHPLFHIFAFVVSSTATCYEPSPAFPLPSWGDGRQNLAPGFAAVKEKIDVIIGGEKYDNSSVSVAVTSGSETLWDYFHTARKQNESRPGTKEVDSDSLYRIASITKTFTTLGVLYQHEAGNLSLDDPITAYVSGLEGEIPWKDITLRILASQLSGIPRDFAQVELLKYYSDPTALGLPPVSQEDLDLPTCDEYDHYKPCCPSDLLEQLKLKKPLFAPNQKSTYSNLNFELLGLALENVTGMKYEDYVHEAILKPLGMESSAFKTPPDTHAVLPLGPNYWDVDEGVQNPTGGIYSSSEDMSKFMRYILSHFNAIATGVNWLMPASWAGGVNSFYGMPFEIFRTDKILKDSRRPVTFATKGGGLPGYFSIISVMPEYNLGLTILVGGESDLLGDVLEVTTTTLIQEAEEAIWRDVDKRYTGSYNAMDASLNSSLQLQSSPSKGLYLTSFVSNNTDVFNNVLPGLFIPKSRPGRGQLVPTLLFKNETAQQGEIWRMIGITERDELDHGVWDEYCITDVDPALYAGLPVNEVVFWHEEGVVELPAWRVKMRASEDLSAYPKLVVQD